MIEIDVVYEGELHCTATHRPSRERLTTDAPTDNMGRGESFSPTDLVAAALGTCMVTTMGVKKTSLPIAGARVNVKKSMTTSPPRRIAQLEVVVEMPQSAKAISQEDRKELEHIAHACPVRLSLLEAMEVPIRFVWP
jgi:putative redox protein